MKRRKMSIEQYLEEEFTKESRPCRKTVINWIKAGIVDGVEFGGKYWVYEKVLSSSDQLVSRVIRSA